MSSQIAHQKVFASIQLALLVSSLFAFSYTLHEVSTPIEEATSEYGPPVRQGFTIFEAIAIKLIEQFKKPLIPRVSAQSNQVGCCSLTKNESYCALSSKDNCKGQFLPDVVCSSASFCKKVCCVDEPNGVYAPNTLASKCEAPNKQYDDATCESVPGARVGCCFLNDKTEMLNERKCEVATKSLLGKNAAVVWKKDFNTAQCRLAANNDSKGACLTGGGDCTFGNARQCADLKGTFRDGYLCTSKDLNTSCEMTTQTKCSGEKVHFIDSCGNTANIYDASRAKDASYWDRIVLAPQSCGAKDANGNAGSKSCGNCNKATGGMCSSAIADNVKPTMGTNYCAPSFCKFKGETYRDGESWCVYDGAIGNGDDVVGSRHWLYVCSQGEVQIEPCSDARQEVCTQKNRKLSNGGDYRQASCKPNNWRSCIGLNRAKDEDEQKENIEKCKSTLHCRVEQVDIADKFSFEFCTPKYPAGVDLRQKNVQNTVAGSCAAATQKCTVVRKAKFFGGCSYAANEGCLGEEFGQKMNNLCRRMGDCGGEVNIAGKYTKNHKISGAPQLSSGWIADLVKLATPVKGQYAEAEDPQALADLIGVWADPGSGGSGQGANVPNTLSTVSMGIGAIGFAASQGWIGGQVAIAATKTTAATSASGVAALGGPLIGAAAGAFLGLTLAKELDLSPGGSMIMAAGGAVLGASVGALLTGYSFTATFLLVPIWGWIVFAVVLIITALFFGGSNCDPIEVEFTCKQWQPPKGGDDCEQCNNDPLKPCSKYRCESLGAACKFVNDFKKNGLCIHENPGDTDPPKITPNLPVISGDNKYAQISDSGFKITTTGGGCIEPRPLLFGVKTSEAAECRISPNVTATFDDMQEFSFNGYSLNHSLRLPVPDPSHGKSNGKNWTGDFKLRVRCQDSNGNENPSPYIIDMCVRQGDDKTPTSIESASPRSGTMIGSDKSTQKVTFSTYELATCKWDHADKKYADMTGTMLCNDTLFRPSTPQGYACRAELPLNGSVNKYYIRCKDQPWLENTPDAGKRNENLQSTEYVLNRPQSKIVIQSITPRDDIIVKTPQALFDLEVATAGGGKMHFCKFSRFGYDKATEMFITGASTSHRQPDIQLAAGNYNFYVECYDETGDKAQNQTSLEIIQDSTQPVISRLAQSGGSITFETQETALCKYDTSTCGFKWGEASSTGTGTKHSIAAKKGQVYYIRCEDGFGNKPDQCSIAVQAV